VVWLAARRSIRNPFLKEGDLLRGKMRIVFKAQAILRRQPRRHDFSDRHVGDLPGMRFNIPVRN